MLIFYKFLMHFTHNDLLRYLLFYLYLLHMNVCQFRLLVFVHIQHLKGEERKETHTIWLQIAHKKVYLWLYFALMNIYVFQMQGNRRY